MIKSSKLTVCSFITFTYLFDGISIELKHVTLLSDLASGETVAVYADLDAQCRKGLKEEYRERKVYVGCGVMQLSRDQIFCSAQVKLRYAYFERRKYLRNTKSCVFA